MEQENFLPMNTHELHRSYLDIVAVHRLNRKVNSKFKSTVVRFVNRKDAFRSLKYKKNLAICGEKLGIFKLFMVENLCPVYRNLMDKCLYLKRSGSLHNVWSHNGIVTFKESSN